MRTLLSAEEIMQYHQVLDAPLGASPDELRQRRNRLLQRFHPDKTPQDQAHLSQDNHHRAQLIQRAYQALTVQYARNQATLAAHSEVGLSEGRTRRAKAISNYALINEWAASSTQPVSEATETRQLPPTLKG